MLDNGLALIWRKGSKELLEVKITHHTSVWERDVFGENVLLVYSYFHTGLLLYVAVEQDGPEELACIWCVNRTILAYSCCVNCNCTSKSFLLIQFKQNASRWKAKQNCMRSDRNTCAVCNSICIVVYLITAWFVFRAKSLFFSQSNHHTFSKRAKPWVEVKMLSCLNASLCFSLSFSITK